MAISRDEKIEKAFRQTVKLRYLRMFPCRRLVDYHFLRFRHIDHRLSIGQREAML